MSSQRIEYEEGIYAIDANYVRPQLAAIHFIVENGRAVVIDTGTNDSVSRTLAELQTLGIALEQVDAIILTHVHLDHAGGAGLLMKNCPYAKLIVHPRGSRHMIDPSKLILGAQAVYGKTQYEQMYGDILPVDAHRVIEAQDGLEWSFEGRALSFLDIPGHARHHIGIFDRKSQSIFTGDTFGLAYRELIVDDQAFIFPSTSPVQFEPEALKNSIGRIMALNPQAAFLTHYAKVENLPKLANDLYEQIDAYVGLCEYVMLDKSAGNSALEKQSLLESLLMDLLIKRYYDLGGNLTEDMIQEILTVDVALNAQGLLVWWDTNKKHP